MLVFTYSKNIQDSTERPEIHHIASFAQGFTSPVCLVLRLLRNLVAIFDKKHCPWTAHSILKYSWNNLEGKNIRL